MKSLFSVFMFALVLSSCAKEDIAPTSDMSENLTGKAKEVHDMVWGKTLTDAGNYLVVGNSITFNDHKDDEAHKTFKVLEIRAFSTTWMLNGTGVTYNGNGYHMEVVESVDYPDQILIRCYVGDAMVTGFWHDI